MRERRVFFAPGNLPFRVVAIALFDEFDGAFHGYFPGKRLANLGVSDRFEAGTVGGVSLPEQSLDFRNEPVPEHLIDPDVYAIVEYRPELGGIDIRSHG